MQCLILRIENKNIILIRTPAERNLIGREIGTDTLYHQTKDLENPLYRVITRTSILKSIYTSSLNPQFDR